MKISDLKERMAEMEIRAKRTLGQNFLVSEQVIARIIEVAKRAEPAFVVEIGPGLGALTDGLADLHPLLIELDRDLAVYWRDRGFQVIEDDALKIQWERLPLPPKTWLVSNLPYQISTHLVVDRCFGPSHLSGMVLMFQKEVAQRLTATVRTSAYGLLSVMAQNFWRMTKVADVSPRDFHPAPKIASRVLKFERLPEVKLDSGFLTFVKVAFAHRRKYLVKNLGALGAAKVDWGLLLEEAGLGPRARAEEVSPAQFASLYSHWKKK